MAEPLNIDVEIAPPGSAPPMNFRLTESGVVEVARIIAYLHHANEELQHSLTHVQTISTQQVERIRLLETEVATLQRLNALLEGR